ncbi:MAG TPA: hypothetical protein VFM55_26945 [Micromonosporaceae bacterium]|nr:hypothetical protein [Micromonosporaceae bacterium]
MRRLVAWAGRNIDGVATLVITVLIVVLDVFSTIEEEWKSSAILLVLGTLVVTMLRDRETVRRFARVPQGLAALESTVATVGRAVDDVSMVRVLTWSEVSATYAEARRTTDRWVFRGGTGTYVRARTLPDCIAHARRARRGLMVRLEIIDPTDEEVCASYGRFRRSLGDDETDWTLERTQRESYATIVACCWYRQRYELLDVQVGLSRVMPTLRWDLSASNLVITQGDPRKPALLVERGKLLYDYLYTELRKSLEQARPVPLEKARHIDLSEMPTLDEVRRLFVALGMPLPGSFTDRDVADIIERALQPENRYDP